MALTLSGSTDTGYGVAGDTNGVRVNMNGTTVATFGASGSTLALQGASSQTGTGITFPAAQVASSNANTLDDYEEGTFTPTLPSGSTGVTYAYQIGRYTKIGRVVYIHIFLYINTITSIPGGVGAALIEGLPFAAENVSNVYHKLTVAWSGCSWTGTVGVCQVNPGTSYITAVGCTDNAGINDSSPALVWDAASNLVVINGFYFV